MEFAHPKDFVQIRPWGNRGDEKCDGWLASESRIFQVYAPNELNQKQTETKIDNDFAGALQHWGGKFSNWTFVHNSKAGVPAFIPHKLQALAELYPAVKFTSWGYSEVRQELQHLDATQLTELFGFAPSAQAMQSVRYSDIEQVLNHVMTNEAPPDSDLRPVPKEKLAANSFSGDVVAFLTLGMRKSGLVDEYFKNHPDPRYGDALAHQFKRKYIEFKESSESSDEIFWKLRGFAGANNAKSDKEEAAALAIITHLFESCDIFERPVPSEGVV
jgi:hypothetical protein